MPHTGYVADLKNHVAAYTENSPEDSEEYPDFYIVYTRNFDEPFMRGPFRPHAFGFSGVNYIVVDGVQFEGELISGFFETSKGEPIRMESVTWAQLHTRSIH